MEPPNDKAVDEFLTADTATRLTLVRTPESAEAIRAWLGDDLFSAYLDLGKVPAEHLGGGPGTNLIFLPGVMGSTLSSRTLGGIWWIDAARNRKRLNDLRLSPDGKSDAVHEYQVEPIAVDMSYDPFRAAALARPEVSHHALFYDWRKPIEASTDALRNAVVAAYESNGGELVNLVAHSMGGLVVRATLMRHPELWRQHIGKIVFLATPHFGSAETAAYLKLHLHGDIFFTLLGRFLSRETFRSMWGVLSLLPAPTGVYPGTRSGEEPSPDWKGPYKHPCVNFNPYDAAAWDLHLSTEATAQLQTILDAAADLHRDLAADHAALEQSRRDRMAVIAGVGRKTVFRFEIKRPAPLLGRSTRAITARADNDPNREGDGRVPVASACLDSVETRYVEAKHARIPAEPDVQSDVFSFLADEPMDTLFTSVRGALDGHLGGEPMTSAAAAIVDAGFPAAIGDPEDPDYLGFDDPEEVELAVLQQALAEGRLPGFEGVSLL